MPRQTWPLFNGMPRIQVEIVLPEGDLWPMNLLADTGAGRANSPFELLLHEDDCEFCKEENDNTQVTIDGAYAGTYRVYKLRVCIPALGFNEVVEVVALNQTPIGFDGIAAFRFLNRFGYGNFRAADQFGLEL